MPRNASLHPLLTALERKATKAFTFLRQEIAKREKELAGLKAEAAQWKNVLGGPARKTNGISVPSQARATKRPRLDWSAVLQALPARFTTKEVVQKTKKPIEQVYAGIGRWVKDRKIKKVDNGYQKASTPTSSRS